MPESYLDPMARNLENHPNRQRWLAAAVQEAGVGTMIALRLREWGLGQGSHVIEVGCAEGGIPIALERAGFRAIGVEILATRIRSAQDRAAESGAAPVFIQATAYTLPVAAGSMDAVVLENVIEHLEDWPSAVREVARVLKPGGVVTITLPNQFGIRTLLADPHWQIFGLTLLPRRVAELIIVRLLKRSDAYGVFEIPSLPRLRRVCAQHGLHVALENGLDRLRYKGHQRTGLKGWAIRWIVSLCDASPLARNMYQLYGRFISEIWIVAGRKTARQDGDAGL